MESEVVSMTASFLGGGPGTTVCGAMTSGEGPLLPMPHACSLYPLMFANASCSLVRHDCRRERVHSLGHEGRSGLGQSDVSKVGTFILVLVENAAA
jgi:hypothetical protein